MTSYIKISTGEFPVYEGDLRLAFPEIQENQTGKTFPCPSDYAPVEILPPPNFNIATHTVDMLPPAFINGAWKVRWSAPRLWTEEEVVLAAKVRARTEVVPPIPQMYQNLDAPGGVPNVVG